MLGLCLVRVLCSSARSMSVKDFYVIVYYYCVLLKNSTKKSLKIN